MNHAGIELRRAGIRHIDNSFVLKEQGEFNGLFQDSELLADVAKIASERGQVVSEAREVLSGVTTQLRTSGS